MLTQIYQVHPSVSRCPNSSKIQSQITHVRFHQSFSVIPSCDFGRDAIDVCNDKLTLAQWNDTDCGVDVSNVFESRCNGKTSCRLVAGFGSYNVDPCPGIYKYTRVAYSCEQNIEKEPLRIGKAKNNVAKASTRQSNTVCEGIASELQCESNERITIRSAIYGRTESDVCNDRFGPAQWNNTNCRLDVAKYYRDACNGKSSCSVVAGIGTFRNDPCVGTYKYTRVLYNCRKMKVMGKGKQISKQGKGLIGKGKQGSQIGKQRGVGKGKRPFGKGKQLGKRSKGKRSPFGKGIGEIGKQGKRVSKGKRALGKGKQRLQVVEERRQSNTVCEGVKSELQCQRNERITVISAVYGRDATDVCNDRFGPAEWSNTNCALDVESFYADKCNGKKSCKLTAGIETFKSDPCIGTYKYTRVSYYCEKVKEEREQISKAVSSSKLIIEAITQPNPVCEGTTSELRCKGNKAINVVNAIYGRDSESVCNDRFGPAEWSNTDCALDVTNVYESNCNGKKLCKVLAGIETFKSDPCVGTYKYTRVSYVCT